ncbi:MAG TPA: ABC transporter permease [Anaerolineae bacterium]
MLTIKQILAIAYKETRLWLQVPGNWLTILLVPFAFIAILGSVFGGNTPVFTVFAANEDRGDLGADVIKLLDNSPNLELELVDTQAEADRRVGQGERMAAVVIPADFSEAAKTEAGGTIWVIIDPARQSNAGLVSGLVKAALSKMLVDASVEREMSKMVFDIKTGDLGGTSSFDFDTFIRAGVKAVIAKQVNEAIDNPLIDLEKEAVSVSANPIEATRLGGLVPGYTLMFLFFLLSHIATAVVEERSLGSLRRLLVTPASKAVILAGKMLPFFFIAIGQMLFVLLVSSWVFNMSLGNSPLALAVIILATALSAATLGILVASLVKNENQAGGLTILVVLVLAVISGSINDSIQIMGLNMVTPHYWARQGMLNVLQRGMGLEGVWLPAGILLGLSVVFFGVGARRFKFE